MLEEATVAALILTLIQVPSSIDRVSSPKLDEVSAVCRRRRSTYRVDDLPCFLDVFPDLVSGRGAAKVRWRNAEAWI
jgi:hypothetical protein